MRFHVYTGGNTRLVIPSDVIFVLLLPGIVILLLTFAIMFTLLIYSAFCKGCVSGSSQMDEDALGN